MVLYKTPKRGDIAIVYASLRENAEPLKFSHLWYRAQKDETRIVIVGKLRNVWTKSNLRDMSITFNFNMYDKHLRFDNESLDGNLSYKVEEMDKEDIYMHIYKEVFFYSKHNLIKNLKELGYNLESITKAKKLTDKILFTKPILKKRKLK